MADPQRIAQASALRGIGRIAIVATIYALSGSVLITALAWCASMVTWKVTEVRVRDAQVPHDTVFIAINEPQVKA